MFDLARMKNFLRRQGADPRERYEKLIEKAAGPCDYGEPLDRELAAVAADLGLKPEMVELDVATLRNRRRTRAFLIATSKAAPTWYDPAAGGALFVEFMVHGSTPWDESTYALVRHPKQDRREFADLAEILKLRFSFEPADAIARKRKLLEREGFKSNRMLHVSELRSIENLSRLPLWRVLFAVAMADAFVAKWGAAVNRKDIVRIYLGTPPEPIAPRSDRRQEDAALALAIRQGSAPVDD